MWLGIFGKNQILFGKVQPLLLLVSPENKLNVIFLDCFTYIQYPHMYTHTKKEEKKREKLFV